MTLALSKSPPPRPARAIVRQIRSRTTGPVTCLMSQSDFGEILKPFVLLDLFDHEGAPFNRPLYSHSGVATLTYILDGAVDSIDPKQPGRRRRMDTGRTRHVARRWARQSGPDPRLPALGSPCRRSFELGRTAIIYQAPGDVQEDGLSFGPQNLDAD